MTNEVISLDQLSPGQRGIVWRVGGKQPIRRRFMEMGFVQGARILVERVAPLGDPVAYRVKRTHLSLRKADAAFILVKRENGSSRA